MQVYQSFQITITQCHNAMMPLLEAAYIKSTLYKTTNSFPFMINEVMCIETLNVEGGYRSGRYLCYWCSLDTIWILLGPLGYCSSTFFWFWGMNVCSCSSHLESASLVLPNISKKKISCKVMPNLSSNFRPQRSQCRKCGIYYFSITGNFPIDSWGLASSCHLALP